MLQKTFEYYHSIKCKPAQVEPPQVQPKPERIEVSFGVGRQIATSEELQKIMSKAVESIWNAFAPNAFKSFLRFLQAFYRSGRKA